MRARPPEKHELDPIETASLDEIQALQLTRLKWSLAHAYENVAHYRQAFDQAGVHPGDVETLDDLVKFPFTYKDDLRQHYPFGMFAVPRDRVIRIHASSGTTGKPTVVGYTQNDIDAWAEVCARSIRASGGRAGDLVHVVYGYGLFTGGLGAHYGAERLGCTVVPMSGGMTERQVQLIQDFKPDIIMVTPSYLLAIADAFEAQGLDARACSLKVGILGAEPWTALMREKIEARFDMDALDIYGLSEVIGPGVSNECIETKDGLHIWEDHFYPEIIDPVTGAVLPDGEKGELVFTSLTKEAFPIIRYRTRDLTRLLPGTARSMRRMEKITGRSDDMLIIRGVNLFPSQIEELILEDERLSPHYVLELRKDGPLDKLNVIVEARPEAADDEARSASGMSLTDQIKSRIGISTLVTVADPATVERSLGKAKRIRGSQMTKTELEDEAMNSEDGINAIASHVVETGYDELPASAVLAAKTFILDGMGVGVAGSAGPWLDGLIASAKTQGTGNDARVWVFGDRLPASAAAMVNAYQMHNSEFDCVHEEAVVHAMTVPLAAAMADSERTARGRGGKADRKRRPGRRYRSPYRRFVQIQTPLFSDRRRPVLSARLRLSASFALSISETLVNAFGIVLAQLSGTMQAHVDGGVMLAMQMGFNARNAIVAADMAERGLSAPKAVLEGEFGFFNLFEGDYDLGPSLDALGTTWRIEELAHKPFPSGRATHGVLDAVLTLKDDHGLAANDIDTITCHVPPLTHQLVGRPIRDVMEANYARLSAPYVLASALISGRLGIDDFAPEALANDDRLDLGRRISIEIEDNPNKNALTPVTVEVVLKDGRTHRITMDVVYGNPAKPMTRDAHLDKFRRNWALAAHPLTADNGERLINMIDALEDISDVADCVNLMSV